jgi:RNA polymerase sigma-70 factor (ECF subfamily)
MPASARIGLRALIAGTEPRPKACTDVGRSTAEGAHGAVEGVVEGAVEGLVEGLVKGEAAGPAKGEPFEEFYRGQGDGVYRALAVALGDADLAREAADEAMLRAYARWSSVGAMDNPGGWVFRVGLNWATSWWRRTRRERPLPVEERHPQVAGPDADTDAVTALAALPLAQRAVVVCRVLLELSTAETATVLGIAEGTVKSRLARALAGLRTTLTEEEPC